MNKILYFQIKCKQKLLGKLKFAIKKTSIREPMDGPWVPESNFGKLYYFFSKLFSVLNESSMKITLVFSSLSSIGWQYQMPKIGSRTNQ